MVTRKTWWQEQYGEDKKNNFVTRRRWGQKNNMVTRRTIWRPKEEHVDKKNKMVTRKTWWQQQYGEN